MRSGGGECPVIGLEDFANWNEYLTSLSPSMVRDQARQWRRIERDLPRLAFRIVERESELGYTLDWILRQKEAWARTRGLQSVWCSERDKRAFLEAVMPGLLADQSLVMGVLADGVSMVSAGWGFRCGRDFVLHAFAYDPSFAGYSPSRLLLERFVQHCFDLRLASSST